MAIASSSVMSVWFSVIDHYLMRNDRDARIMPMSDDLITIESGTTILTPHLRIQLLSNYIGAEHVHTWLDVITEKREVEESYILEIQCKLAPPNFIDIFILYSNRSNHQSHEL